VPTGRWLIPVRVSHQARLDVVKEHQQGVPLSSSGTWLWSIRLGSGHVAGTSVPSRGASKSGSGQTGEHMSYIGRLHCR
jgi:hypothetical protein